MGMFDDVRVLMELPGNDTGEDDFQTKDMDCLLNRYEIGTDRILRLDGSPVTGESALNFYTSLHPKNRGSMVPWNECGWLEYDATLCPHCGYVVSVSKSARCEAIGSRNGRGESCPSNVVSE